MANPKINISSIDFNGIKSSLKTYLSGKPEFSGYDFSGSGMNLFLDVLAYNTMFYSFYSNMIANETYLDTAKLENSIVSLVKPLGYLVPSRTSSKVNITAVPSGTSTTVTLSAYSDYFSGLTPQGTSHRFYPIEDVTLTTGTDTDLVLYEGVSVVRNLPVSVLVAEQKAFLTGAFLDIDTITVKVNGETWTRFNTYQSSSGPDGKVYFLDRTSSGFYLIFGKRTLNDYQTSFGKNIEENDEVTVSYLIPSGSVANGITNLLNAGVTIKNTFTSGSGTDSPDLDLVKFFAPKLFAANDRAVTKDDYYGLLLASGLLPEGIDTEEEINVWGGEENDPASHGRVFVSYSNPDLTIVSPAVKKSMEYLKEKSIVTVIPEYIQSKLVNVYLDVQVTSTSAIQTSGVASKINSIYNTPLRFNNNIKTTDIRSALLTTYPTITAVGVSSTEIEQEVTGSGSEKILYFKNVLLSPSGSAVTVNSTPFSHTGQTIRLVDQKITGKTTGNIIAVNSTTSTEITNMGILGTVNYSMGVIELTPSAVPIDTTIRIKAKLQTPDSVIIKDEFLINVTSTVTRV
jgi:hypothetical protein